MRTTWRKTFSPMLAAAVSSLLLLSVLACASDDYVGTTIDVPASSSTTVNTFGGPVGPITLTSGGDTKTLAPTTAATPAGYEDLDGPLLVASAESGDLDAKWQELSASAADLERSDGGSAEEAGTPPDAIPGFEPFNDPRIALSDGRFVVRGRWDGDEPIAGWYQQNPASVPEGEDNPVMQTTDRPVRLFVYDPAGGGIKPVSHIPQVHAFSTAAFEGESPDVVLTVVVLAGEVVVAYTSGFNGAAYDIPYELYVAPIPPPASGG